MEYGKQLLLEKKLIAIVRGVTEHHEQLTQALYDGGIRIVEVTFNQREPECFTQTTQAIAKLRQTMGDKMMVGAGTVLTTAQVELAHQAGAQLIVAPDTNPAVIQRTKELGMCSIPGGMTPTEIQRAYEMGADFVKVFPAHILGPDYIKAIRAPLGQIPLLAVGGISEQNLATYLDVGCSGAGIGGNLVNGNWVKDNQWDRITELAAQLCRCVERGRETQL